MQNSIYKIKYLLFLSWDWEAWFLTQSGGVYNPPPERSTAWNKGRKCFHCLEAPNNLIPPGTIWSAAVTELKTSSSDEVCTVIPHLWAKCFHPFEIQWQLTEGYGEGVIKLMPVN